MRIYLANQSGTGVVTLGPTKISGNTDLITIHKLLICNNDNTDISFNLYLNDGSDSYYLGRSIVVPLLTTLDFFAEGTPYMYEKKYELKLNLTNAGYVADTHLLID